MVDGDHADSHSQRLRPGDNRGHAGSEYRLVAARGTTGRGHRPGCHCGRQLYAGTRFQAPPRQTPPSPFCLADQGRRLEFPQWSHSDRYGPGRLAGLVSRAATTWLAAHRTVGQCGAVGSLGWHEQGLPGRTLSQRRTSFSSVWRPLPVGRLACIPSYRSLAGEVRRNGDAHPGGRRRTADHRLH